MKRNAQRGFTLFELVVALAVTMLLVGGATFLFLGQHRGLANVTYISSSGQSARLALEQLTRELHMAGFGVVGQQAITAASLYSIQFMGDLQANVVATLGANANAGALTVQVPINSSHTVISAGDYLFINGGGTNLEMEPVATVGTIVDYTTNPATIHLNQGLKYSYTAGQAVVRTVETVTYAVTFPSGVMTRNGVTVADRLANFEFHYYGENDEELPPDPVNGLSQVQRAATRRIELRMQAGGLAQNVAPQYRQSVEMRNMGLHPYPVDICPPNPPTNVTVTKSDTCGQFSLSWTPPTTNACDNSPTTDLAGYHIFYGIATGSYFAPPVNVTPETRTIDPVQDSRLNNNSTYYVAMTAYDSSFNESVKSTEMSFTIVDTTPPGAPSGDATAGANVVNLTWTPPTDLDVRGFRIYRTTSSPVATTAANRIVDENTLVMGTTTYADTTVVPCTMYHYVITAVDCENEGAASNEIYGNGSGTGPDQPNNGVTNTTATKSPATGPAAPTSFVAAARYQSADLYWTNPADVDTAGVMIRWSTTGYPTSTSNGTLVATVSGSPSQAMSYSATGLTNGTKYYFSIFAYNKCLIYSSTAANAYATPGATPPVVQIMSPASGATVTNGQLIFQANAYAPDADGLHNPADINLDDGKGIANVKMWAAPDPGTSQFPVYPTAPQFCGFGGSSNPCSAGNVTQWCDGTYSLYAMATDNITSQTATTTLNFTVHDGGFYVDPTVSPTVGGTYYNQGSFGLGNDAVADASIITSLTMTWNTVQARLKTVEIPTGTTVWTYSGTPAASGSVVNIPAGSRPTIPSGGKATIRLTFTQVSTTLTSSAASGQKVLQVASATGFVVSDPVYLTNGTNSDSNVVGSVSGTTITLTNNLTHAYSSGATLWHRQNQDDMDIATMQLTLVAGYQKAGVTGATCTSNSANVTFTAAPLIGVAEQDLPVTNTLCSTVPAAIQVNNYYPVPTHMSVTDQSESGIASATAYYYVDSSFQAVAPTSGYTSAAMTYDATNVVWRYTIPANHGVRIWLYFSTQDNDSEVTNSPTTGAYCYDYKTDTTIPACPTGLTATKVSGSTSKINLAWTANTEPDLAGYNIYREKKGSSFSKIASSVAGTSYQDTGLSTNSYCYIYYITAVDLSGNESQSCSGHTAGAGSGTCP